MQVVLELKHKMQKILMSQEAYVGLDPDFLFLLIKKDITGLQYADVANYMLLKSLFRINLN